MKKTTWYFLAVVVAGIAMIAASFRFYDVFVNADMIRSIGFGFVGAGAFRMFLYWRQSRPKYRAKYEEQLRRRNIELNDEMKRMLRQKAAHTAYVVTMQVMLFAGVLLLFLGAPQWVVNLLFLLMLGQYLLGMLVYYRLLRKQTQE